MSIKKLIEDFANKFNTDEDILILLKEAYSLREINIDNAYNFIDAAKLAIEKRIDNYRQVISSLNEIGFNYDFLHKDNRFFHLGALLSTIRDIEKIIAINNKKSLEPKSLGKAFNEFNLSKIKLNLDELKLYLEDYKKKNPSNPIDCPIKFINEYVNDQLKGVAHE